MANFLENIPSVSINEFHGNKVLYFGTSLKRIFTFGRAKARLIIENFEAIEIASSTITIQNGQCSMTLTRTDCHNISIQRNAIENFANGRPLDYIINRPAAPIFSDYAELRDQMVCIASGKLYKTHVERSVIINGRPVYAAKPYDWQAWWHYEANKLNGYNA